ncbi:zinc finger CCCH domain-containing protein 18-like isoform X4 [Ornithodoros turicata]|uniref:zinc finger CCCH domain-containing protein 18-like isoform X4 n=1 Tax=Ornithodoros turicata TaxID=34597 RepID=UPI003138A649
MAPPKKVLSAEDIAARKARDADRRRARRAQMSKEAKARIAAAVRERRAQMTEEQRAQQAQRDRQRRSQMSVEDKARHAEAERRRRAQMSDEQKARRAALEREKRRRKSEHFKEEAVKRVCVQRSQSADSHFKPGFANNTFGAVCSVCDGPWFENDTRPVTSAMAMAMATGDSLQSTSPGEHVRTFRVSGTCRPALAIDEVPLLSRSYGYRYPELPSHLPRDKMYADSQEEYIVPTTTDPSMPSTSGTSSADATSLRLSEVRSLADPPSSAQELLSIQIKEEVTDEQMEQESFQQPSRSPPTATVTSTPLVTFPEAISESAPILPPHPVFSTSEPAHLPSLTEPEAQPAIAAPSLDATRPPLEQTTTTGGFNRSRKRPATPWITLSATERKAKVELEILFAQRRKIEAELRKFEADERKVVAETLLLAEEMKRCEEEKKKFKAEAEFFLQEKAKSEEETKKAAAKAALLLEHKNFYVEQQKTEMVRRRMLLLEMRKMKHDLKLLQ